MSTKTAFELRTFQRLTPRWDKARQRSSSRMRAVRAVLGELTSPTFFVFSNVVVDVVVFFVLTLPWCVRARTFWQHVSSSE